MPSSTTRRPRDSYGTRFRLPSRARPGATRSISRSPSTPNPKSPAPPSNWATSAIGRPAPRSASSSAARPRAKARRSGPPVPSTSSASLPATRPFSRKCARGHRYGSSAFRRHDMKIFLDTASVTELKEGVAMGLVDGCTTNPSLIGKELKEIANNVVVKCPLTKDGLKAVKHLSGEGIRVNQTLCFSAPQALLSAKAGATYISPFLGRLDDIGAVGMDLIRDICLIYKNYGYKTQVLAASIRNPIHVIDAAKAGAHVSTMPFNVLEQLIKHPLTDIGLKKFLDDWT